MAGSVQLLHQPDLVRILQQQIPPWIRRHLEISKMLRHPPLLRFRRPGQLVVDEPQEVVLLRDNQQQQQLDAPSTVTRHERLLHFEQLRSLSEGWETSESLFRFGGCIAKKVISTIAIENSLSWKIAAESFAEKSIFSRGTVR